MHSSTTSASSSGFSLASLVQYVVLAGVAYFLAGAPLSSSLTTSTSPSSTAHSAAGNAAAESRKPDSLVIPEANLTCSPHAYRGVYVLSREPLVVYIEGFLSDTEAKEVVQTR